MERATRSNFSHMCKKKKNCCTCSYDFVLVPPDTKNEFRERSRDLTPVQTGHEKCIKKNEGINKFLLQFRNRLDYSCSLKRTWIEIDLQMLLGDTLTD